MSNPIDYWYQKYIALKKDKEDMYLRGVRDMREQMLNGSVEGEVVKDINNKLAVTAKNVNLDKFKFGDKVRIIILPKED